MRRTFKRPDGTEEVLEGTAEELAEYERKLRESDPAARRVDRPGVLKGASVYEPAPWEILTGSECLRRASEGS